MQKARDIHSAWRETGTVWPREDADGNDRWSQCLCAPLDLGEGIVVVDALMVVDPNSEPCHPRIVPESRGHPADNVFHEGRIVVGMHCHVSFVLALQKGIHRG